MSRAAFLLAMALIMVSPARANMASPTQPGSPAGEPPEALVGLRVQHERLVLDLRPLAHGSSTARIEAEYRIVNEGAARRVPLVFVALGGDPEAARAWLDGTPAPARWLDSLAVPEAWYAATTTPALGGGDPLPFEADAYAARGLAFVLDVPPGLHVVRVEYAVAAGSTDDGDHPNRTWQLAYSLAPARFWAGFGVLDVAVRVPTGWDAAASLPLRRETTDEGAALVGQFRGVPGDVLTVSARGPEPGGRLPIRLAGLAGALLAVVGAGRLGARLTRRRAAVWALPVSLLGGVLAAVALVGSSMAVAGLGDSAAASYGAGVVGLLVVGPVALVLGTVLAQLLAVRWRRRA